MQAITDFLSGIWQTIIHFPKSVFDSVLYGLSKAGGYVLDVLARAGAFLISLRLQLLQWTAIIRVTVIVLVLIVGVLIKYFEHKENVDQEAALLWSHWQSTSAYQTFSYNPTRGATPFSAPRPSLFNFGHTGFGQPFTSNGSTRGPGVGHSHQDPTEPGRRTYHHQEDDGASREEQRLREEAIRKEEERRRAEEAARESQRLRDEAAREEKERRCREEERKRQAEEAARRGRFQAEATSRAFDAWIKRTSDITAEELRKMGHIPGLPACAVPGPLMACSQACEQVKADSGIALCRHSMARLIEMYTRVNMVGREELLRRLVRVWHPDKQKFIRSGQRVREQAAEMTKILNGMVG